MPSRDYYFNDGNNKKVQFTPITRKLACAYFVCGVNSMKVILDLLSNEEIVLIKNFI